MAQTSFNHPLAQVAILTMLVLRRGEKTTFIKWRRHLRTENNQHIWTNSSESWNTSLFWWFETMVELTMMEMERGAIDILFFSLSQFLSSLTSVVFAPFYILYLEYPYTHWYSCKELADGLVHLYHSFSCSISHPSPFFLFLFLSCLTPLLFSCRFSIGCFN